MKFEQIYQVVNEMANEITGKSDLVKEDLSNITDIGKEIFDNTDTENFAKKLIDHIGKVVFVTRQYTGKVPSMLRDSWEYGSVLEKIRCELPTATANDTWQLEDGQTYNQDVFTSPKVSAKFFNRATTFEIPMSYADRQCKSAFDNLTQLNAFFSMIETYVKNAMTVRTEALIMSNIRFAMGYTVNHIFGDETDYSTRTDAVVRNLRAEYNNLHGTSLTMETCLDDYEFMQYVARELDLQKGYMSQFTTLYNNGAKETFTPADKLNFVLLDCVNSALKSKLYSNTYHDEWVKLDGFSTVPSWQGLGKTRPTLATVSKIMVKSTQEDATFDIEMNGIIGFMADMDGLMVACENDRVTNHYNGKAEFTNNWYKRDARYLYDPNENFVIFTIA